MEKVNIDTLKEKYPNAYQEYRKWIAKVTALEDEKEVAQYADIIILSTPRMLLDFFDIKGLYISIKHQEPDMWGWHVYSSNTGGAVEDSRAEAEQKAIIEAFNTLETKL